MTEPLRDKHTYHISCYCDTCAHATQDLMKSAVEHRKQWKPINNWSSQKYLDVCFKCEIGYFVLFKKDENTPLLCYSCVEEHCYPDLFTVEKGDDEVQG